MRDTYFRVIALNAAYIKHRWDIVLRRRNIELTTARRSLAQVEVVHYNKPTRSKGRNVEFIGLRGTRRRA